MNTQRPKGQGCGGKMVGTIMFLLAIMTAFMAAYVFFTSYPAGQGIVEKIRQTGGLVEEAIQPSTQITVAVVEPPSQSLEQVEQSESAEGGKITLTPPEIKNLLATPTLKMQESQASSPDTQILPPAIARLQSQPNVAVAAAPEAEPEVQAPAQPEPTAQPLPAVFQIHKAVEIYGPMTISPDACQNGSEPQSPFELFGEGSSRWFGVEFEVNTGEIVYIDLSPGSEYYRGPCESVAVGVSPQWDNPDIMVQSAGWAIIGFSFDGGNTAKPPQTISLVENDGCEVISWSQLTNHDFAQAFATQKAKVLTFTGGDIWESDKGGCFHLKLSELPATQNINGYHGKWDKTPGQTTIALFEATYPFDGHFNTRDNMTYEIKVEGAPLYVAPVTPPYLNEATPWAP